MKMIYIEKNTLHVAKVTDEEFSHLEDLRDADPDKYEDDLDRLLSEERLHSRVTYLKESSLKHEYCCDCCG